MRIVQAGHNPAALEVDDLGGRPSLIFFGIIHRQDPTILMARLVASDF